MKFTKFRLNCTLDLGLDIVDGVRRLHLKGDGLAREGLHENLHVGFDMLDRVLRACRASHKKWCQHSRSQKTCSPTQNLRSSPGRRLLVISKTGVGVVVVDLPRRCIWRLRFWRRSSNSVGALQALGCSGQQASCCTETAELSP